MNKGVIIRLREQDFLCIVDNDTFGLCAAQEWKRLISPYTPRRDGALEDTAQVRPFEIEYIQPYSKYMYEGVILEDPLLHVSGIYNKSTDEWFSRPGVKKVPRTSGKTAFNYLHDPNPYATDHWDDAAIKAKQDEKLTKAMQEYVNRRNNNGI